MKAQVAWWLGLLAVGACRDTPVGPVHRITFIAVSDTIQGRLLTGGGELQYAFPARADSSYAVFVQTLGGPLLLSVSDTARVLPLSSTMATPGLGLLDRATEPFQFGDAPVLLVVDGSDSGVFRLLVYPVHRAPESRSARFALGDTVTESLETLADIDTFVVAGTAGQEAVGYLQALGTNSPGIVSLGLETWTNSRPRQHPAPRWFHSVD